MKKSGKPMISMGFPDVAEDDCPPGLTSCRKKGDYRDIKTGFRSLDGQSMAPFLRKCFLFPGDDREAKMTGDDGLKGEDFPSWPRIVIEDNHVMDG